VAVAQEREMNTNRNENKAQAGLVTSMAQGQTAEAVRERVQTLRQETQTTMATQRERVTQRVAEIKDKVRQVRAQKLSGQFDNLNATWTDHFMNLLDRYEAIVQKIQTRADIAAGTGKDVTAVTAAIQTAKTAISDARAEVTTQVAKTYTPTVADSEETTTQADQEVIIKNLRESFQNLHSTLFNDLFALRDGAMKNTRTAVQSALQSLSAIPGVDD
jgi:hypothetical protein